MKVLLALLVTLGAAQSFACEQLAGKWSCVDKEGSEADFEMSFKNVNGVLNLFLNGPGETPSYGVPTDGSDFTTPEGDKLNVSCLQDSLKVLVSTQDYDMTETFVSKDANAMEFTASVNSDTVVLNCKRQ